MGAYIAKRVMLSFATLLAVLFILFMLMDLMPGSPFNDEKQTPEQIARSIALYGLDKPWPARFGRYALNMLTGNFGVSYVISKNIPVTDLLKTRFAVSARIGLQAVALGASLGVLLGVASAIRHNTLLDRACALVSVIGISIPSYVFALTLSYAAGFKLGWFPLLYQPKQAIASSVLPTVALSLGPMASLARFSRAEMLDAMDSDYIQLAKSKGVHGPRLIASHMLRNAMIPIVTVLAPLVVGLMTGSLVIEKIFSVPGIGSLLITAIQSNDYNVAITLSFIYCAMYIGFMLIVDILYGVIDPRIRLVKEAGFHD
ncbi:MAG: ABC transporter permease [Clostridiales bacterium]|jgi:oligopeptide transport system permease protein|nr:ABC transporter permease [Clostridiales bacterium]